MNFVSAFKQGKEGQNFGLTTGLPALDRAINGLQRKMSIGLAAAPKVGKTKLADFAALYNPYLQVVRMDKKAKELTIQLEQATNDTIKEGLRKQLEKLITLDDIEWIYYSFEIDRITKEFNTAAFFMAHDYGIYSFQYKDTMYEMSGDYLMGRLLHKVNDEENEVVIVSPDHEEKLKLIYLNRIVPLFGEYDTEGKLITHNPDGSGKPKPKIEFIENRDNPTGMNKHILNHARKNGKFIERSHKIDTPDGPKTTTEIIGYKPKNPKKYTIVITDHVRKLKRERGFTMKENIDKWLEYSTELRNLLSYTFVHVAHSNRGVANVERLRMAGEFIFPTGDDVKDSGNLSEECTIVLTMFNPHDEKYNLQTHFGHELKDNPNYRSIHLVESRNTFCPAHIFVDMFASTGVFAPQTSH